MDSKELRTIADGLMDDEAEIMASILALRNPRPIDAFSDKVRGRRFCPKCGERMWKNGTDNGHQKWVCPGCRETVRSGGLGPAESAKKKAVVWLRFVSCELRRMTIREIAAACGISATQAFYMRHKMQEALSERLGRATLSGRAEWTGNRSAST